MTADVTRWHEQLRHWKLLWELPKVRISMKIQLYFKQTRQTDEEEHQKIKGSLYRCEKIFLKLRIVTSCLWSSCFSRLLLPILTAVHSGSGLQNGCDTKQVHSFPLFHCLGLPTKLWVDCSSYSGLFTLWNGLCVTHQKDGSCPGPASRLGTSRVYSCSIWVFWPPPAVQRHSHWCLHIALMRVWMVVRPFVSALWQNSHLCSLYTASCPMPIRMGSHHR